MNYKQSRAARGLLGWTQQSLADAANVSLATIQFFETSKREPIPNNLAAIRRALEEAGVEFIPAKNGKGIGVRLREEQYKGTNETSYTKQIRRNNT
jgi:transcriptional regulator with XRE-family HTH domain